MIILIFHVKKLKKLVWIRCKVSCLQLLGFWNFFVFSDFFRSNSFIFEPKVEKKDMGSFFHSICAPDLNFGTKNIGRTKLSNLKTLIFANFWGPEVVGSSSHQKNIDAKFTHLYIPSLCKEFIVMLHNLGHSIFYAQESIFTGFF